MYTDKVEKQNMSQETVEIVLNYLLSYWTSNKNLSYGHTIQIGFYGGEPLVNFPLIEKIIHICENIKKKTGLIFAYSMTTNAVLLHKYKRFIVEHQQLNTNDFGKIRIATNGYIYANPNYQPIGKWDDDYKKLIYNELRHGNSWRRTRDKQAICKECIYKYLCPSPSNYEIAIQKPNLCNL